MPKSKAAQTRENKKRRQERAETKAIAAEAKAIEALAASERAIKAATEAIAIAVAATETKTTKVTTDKPPDTENTDETPKKRARGIVRARNYATTVYPDSVPVGWNTILTEHKIPALISPLHANDINPDGTPKKAHWHVIIMFENVKTEAQAREVFDTIGGVGIETIKSLRAYARYLCHLDHPEKAQYKTDYVISLCGADYQAIIALESDKLNVLREMRTWCKDTQTTSYATLLEHAEIHHPTWYRVLCLQGGSPFIDRYLKSLKWTLDQEANPTMHTDEAFQRQAERIQAQRALIEELTERNIALDSAYGELQDDANSRLIELLEEKTELELQVQRIKSQQ
jgi:hypothetical protein